MKGPNKTFMILLLSLMVTSALAQEKAVVFGNVKDEHGNAVEYANVAVSGYAGGVATDNRGNFELTVPASTELTLMVSFIGYEKLSISHLLRRV